MARPEKIKTEMGQRLRDVRRALGDIPRDQFALAINVNAKTLSNYERGDSLPDSDALKAYNEKYGIDINWLLTGKGEMFADSISTPSSLRTVDTMILIKIAGKVEDVYKGLGQRPTKAHITGVAADIYNDMLNTGTDFNDDDELTATIALEMVKLKKRILNGDINPDKAAALN